MAQGADVCIIKHIHTCVAAASYDFHMKVSQHAGTDKSVSNEVQPVYSNGGMQISKIPHCAAFSGDTQMHVD